MSDEMSCCKILPTTECLSPVVTSQLPAVSSSSCVCLKHPWLEAAFQCVFIVYRSYEAWNSSLFDLSKEKNMWKMISREDRTLFKLLSRQAYLLAIYSGYLFFCCLQVINRWVERLLACSLHKLPRARDNLYVLMKLKEGMLKIKR